MGKRLIVVVRALERYSPKSSASFKAFMQECKQLTILGRALALNIEISGLGMLPDIRVLLQKSSSSLEEVLSLLNFI